jgi:hypothetical protein
MLRLLFPIVACNPWPGGLPSEDAFTRPRLLPHANARQRVEQSKYIEEPQHHADDDDCVQDRLNAARHGYETIHQPQQNAHYDQGYENLNERHTFFTFLSVLLDTSAGIPGVANVLFDFLSYAGRGDLAEEEGLANTTILLPQSNLGPCRGGCLFPCIQF